MHRLVARCILGPRKIVMTHSVVQPGVEYPELKLLVDSVQWLDDVAGNRLVNTSDLGRSAVGVLSLLVPRQDELLGKRRGAWDIGEQCEFHAVCVRQVDMVKNKVVLIPVDLSSGAGKVVCVGELLGYAYQAGQLSREGRTDVDTRVWKKGCLLGLAVLHTGRGGCRADGHADRENLTQAQAVVVDRGDRRVVRGTGEGLVVGSSLEQLLG